MKNSCTFVFTALILLLARDGHCADEKYCKFADRVTLFPLTEKPKHWKVLHEDEKEIWALVDEWTHPPTKRGAGVRFWEPIGNGRLIYRRQSPFVIFDKAHKKWFLIGLTKLFWHIYPIKKDPYDPNLIWFGLNDAASNVHADGPSAKTYMTFQRAFAFGDRGGIALLNIKERTVEYFGAHFHLVGRRVRKILFEEDAVWIFAKYPLGGEQNGISRYDRKTKRMIPFPIERQSADDGWLEPDFHFTKEDVWVLAKTRSDCFTRHRFSKGRLEWLPVSYVWVKKGQATVRSAPLMTSDAMYNISASDHLGNKRWFHKNPLVVLRTSGKWIEVLTPTNKSGWMEKELVIDTYNLTLEIMKNESEIDKRFLYLSSMYLSNLEMDKVLKESKNLGCCKEYFNHIARFIERNERSKSYRKKNPSNTLSECSEFFSDELTSVPDSGEWRDGEKHGNWVHFHPNGKKRSEGVYRKGKRHGLWVYWHENGHESGKGKYIDGEKEGPWTYWLPNGQIKSRGGYKSGQKEGLWTNWEHKTIGTSTWAGAYKEGKKTGKWVYKLNDKVYREEHFLDGLWHGKIEHFDGKGKSSSYMHFRNGLLHGERKDRNGEVSNYREGVISDENGRPTEEGIRRKILHENIIEIRKCLEILHSHPAYKRTEAKLFLSVGPSGRIKKFEIQPVSLAHTEGGRCLERVYKSLYFAKFKGEPIELKYMRL